jgi:hypothetical protein
MGDQKDPAALLGGARRADGQEAGQHAGDREQRGRVHFDPRRRGIAGIVDGVSSAARLAKSPWAPDRRHLASISLPASIR